MSLCPAAQCCPSRPRRRLALPSFSPKAVAAYHDRIARTVNDLLNRAETAGEFDLVSSFAAPLPITVITDLLGIPDADAEEFARYGAVIGSALDGIKSLQHARQLQASDAALRRLFAELFELRRVALEPLEVAGKAIRPGQWVDTLIGGANRDPAVYDSPSTFDIHRASTADHLAFSSGIHYCIGQPLARLEASIALQTLAERMPGLSHAGTVQRRKTTTIRGPARLPVSTGRPRAPQVLIPARRQAQSASG